MAQVPIQAHPPLGGPSPVRCLSADAAPANTAPTGSGGQSSPAHIPAQSSRPQPRTCQCTCPIHPSTRLWFCRGLINLPSASRSRSRAFAQDTSSHYRCRQPYRSPSTPKLSPTMSKLPPGLPQTQLAGLVPVDRQAQPPFHRFPSIHSPRRQLTYRTTTKSSA